MSKKMKNVSLKWSYEVQYFDGQVFRAESSYSTCKEMFALHIGDVINRHSPVKSISLYDGCHRLYKQYKQLF